MRPVLFNRKLDDIAALLPALTSLRVAFIVAILLVITQINGDFTPQSSHELT